MINIGQVVINIARNIFTGGASASNATKCRTPRNMSQAHKAIHKVIVKAFEGAAFNGVPLQLKDGAKAYWLAETGEQEDCYWWLLGSHDYAPVNGGILGVSAGINNLLANNPALREYQADTWERPLRIQVNKPNPEPIPLFPDVWNILRNSKDYPVNKFGAMMGFEHVFRQTNIVVRSIAKDEAMAHWLIAAGSGGGKTTMAGMALLTMALLNDPEHLSLVIIDPKNDDFAPSAMQRLPHLACPIIVDPQDAVAAINGVVQEMWNRSKQPKTDKHGKRITYKHRIVVFVDEINTLVSYAPDVLVAMERIAQTGRSYGIHLIIGTQRPTVDVVKGAIKANINTRMIGKVASAEEAYIASGRKDTGAEKLPGKGMFVSCIGSDERLLRAAYVDWKYNEQGHVDAMVNDIIRRWNGIEPVFAINIVRGEDAYPDDIDRSSATGAPTQEQTVIVEKSEPIKTPKQLQDEQVEEDNQKMINALVELVQTGKVKHISQIASSTVRRQLGLRIIQKEIGGKRAAKILNMAAEKLGQSRDEKINADQNESEDTAEDRLSDEVVTQLLQIIMNNNQSDAGEK